MEVIRHDDKCMVKSSRSSSLVEAAILDFNDKSRMTVVINKAIKLTMVWNGKCYEGRYAGLDFESAGPKVTKTTTSIRG